MATKESHEAAEEATGLDINERQALVGVDAKLEEAVAQAVADGESDPADCGGILFPVSPGDVEHLRKAQAVADLPLADEGDSIDRPRSWSPARLEEEDIPVTRNPVTLTVMEGSEYRITVDHAIELREVLDRQIPSDDDALHRLSTAQLGHLGEAIGKGFADASGCKPHAMIGGRGFADKVVEAIQAGFETLAARMPPSG